MYSSSWNNNNNNRTYFSKSSNVHGMTTSRCNKRSRDSSVKTIAGNSLNNNNDREIDPDFYNLDLEPIKRLRIESVSPEPELTQSQQQDYSSPLLLPYQDIRVESEAENNSQTLHLDYEMVTTERCDDGGREDGTMESLFATPTSSSQFDSSSNYQNMNCVLGSLHAERMKRMSQDRNSAKATTASMDKVYLTVNQNYASEMNHSSVNTQHSNSLSQQNHQQSYIQPQANNQGQVQHHRQTRLRCNSQLY